MLFRSAALAVGLILGFWAAWLWLGRRWGAPLKEVTRVAEALARGHHEARVTVDAGAPLASLSTTINLLAEKFQHDISELRRLEQVRKEFVANVSHELRTPLSAIKAFAETLSAGYLAAAERAEFLR